MKGYLLAVVFVCCGINGLAGEEFVERVWTSTAGTSMTGTLSDVKAQTVLINTSEGIQLAVPIRSLSSADRSYAMDAQLEKNAIVVATSQRRVAKDANRKKSPKALGWALPELAKFNNYQVEILRVLPKNSHSQSENVARIHKSLMDDKYEDADRYVLLDPSVLFYQEEEALKKFKMLMSQHEHTARTSGVTLLMVYPKVPGTSVVYNQRERRGKEPSFGDIGNGVMGYIGGRAPKTIVNTRTPQECQEILDEIAVRGKNKWTTVPVGDALAKAPPLDVISVEVVYADGREFMKDVSLDFDMTLDDYLYDSTLFSFLTYHAAPLSSLKRAQIANDKKEAEERASPLPSFSDADLDKASSAILSAMNTPKEVDSQADLAE